MSGWKQFLMVAAALSATPAFAQPAPNFFPQIPQVPQVPQVPQIPQIPFAPQDLDTVMANANAGLARTEKALAQSEASFSTWPDLAGLPSKMSALFTQSGMLFQNRTRAGKFDGDYDNGTRALDDHKYDEAIGRFDAVIDSK